MSLPNFQQYVLFKKTTAVVFSLWERASQKQFDQHTNEWMLQLIESQLEATSKLSLGPIQRELFIVLTCISIQSNKGDTIRPIDLMDRIDNVFVKRGVPKLRKNDKWFMIVFNC